MEKTPTVCCCCPKHAPTRDETRRCFLSKVAAVVCGGFALLVPAFAGIAAFLNPLRLKSQSGDFVKLTALDMLPEDGTPHKVPVIADRVDAWNTYPAEPIGAVYLRRTGKEVTALQVICPHAGCSIGFVASAEGGKFFCPCHIANFDLAGKRTDSPSPSPRDMDSLEVDVRGNEVWVKFQTFGLGTAKKVAQG
jgi:menaquinol-cytochrome c reductase iron-sulfur subunit